MTIKFPCSICSRTVAKNHRAIECDLCKRWVHIKCNYITPTQYESLKVDVTNWYCINCMKEAIPFSNSNDDNLKLILQGKNLQLISETNQENKENQNAQLFKEIDQIKITNNTNITNESLYYTVSELNSKTQKSKQNNLSALHLNIGSLGLHIDELDTLTKLVDNNFDFIGISETKITKNTPPTINIELENYNTEHCPTESSKGGSLLYISKKYDYKVRKDLSLYKCKELESIFVEILNPKRKNIIVGCIYKHPCMDITEFNQFYITKLLEKLSFEHKDIVLLGDFNIDLMHFDTDNNTCDFLDLMTSNSLLPTIMRPTRFTSHSKTLIDNIFTNIVEFDNISGNITYPISDHLSQFTIINTQPPLKNKTKVLPKRDFSKFNRDDFLLDILEIDWKHEIETEKNNPNYSLEKLLNITNLILDEHAPYKKVPKKFMPNSTKPWLTKGIIKSIHNKHKIYKKFIKTKDPTQKQQQLTMFKRYRNLVLQLSRTSKKNYFNSFFTNNKNNLKKAWQGIKSIINCKNSNSNIPTSMMINNQITTDTKIIGESFNNYFGTIAGITKDKIIKTDKHFSEFLNNPNNNSFLAWDSNKIEVYNIIMALDSDKVTGPCSIPTNILKLIAPTLSEHLSNIINISFKTGIFPTCIKSASITPIHKKDSKLSIENYRPISLLSNISKIFEKLMHSRLCNFLTQNKYLYENQFGFRTKHSTTHALVQISEAIRNAIDSGNFACGVFVDLQKAFDTVDHNILLKKLEYYGVRGVINDWFRTYLSDRKQSVTILGEKSNEMKILHGVPQGSVLGPLLFLIYINDLNKAIKHSSVYHFADDTHLLNINKSIKKINQQVNNDLKFLCVWLRANKISLNTKKTEIIIFRSKNKATIKKHLNFRLSGQKVNLSSQVKYLGLILDQHLTWDSHLKTLSLKLNRAAGMLAKIRHYVPRDVLHSIYYAIFNSHLTYGCQIWGQHQSQLLNKIQIIQNKALRIINFKTPREHADPLYSQSSILKINDYIKLLNCIFAYDQHKQNLPEVFKDFLTPVNEIHQHSTRTLINENVSVPQSNTVLYGLHSIKHQCAIVWNNMQNNLKSKPSVLTKSKLKEELTAYYLDKYV